LREGEKCGWCGIERYGQSERGSAADAADGEQIAMTRSNRAFTCLKVFFGLLLPLSGVTRPAAQDEAARFHVNVVLVQLNVAVTDGKGDYISHLRPEDFAIKEDNLPERIATFEEGDEMPRRFPEGAPSGERAPGAADAPEPGHPALDHTLV
jgi:hypothetical protein